MTKRKRHISTIIYLLVLLVMLSLLYRLVTADRLDDLPYSSIVEQLEAGNVRSFSVKDNVITLSLWTPLDGKTVFYCRLADPASFRAECGELIRQQHEAGILETYDFLPDSEPSVLSTILPWFLMGLSLILIWVILANRASGGNGVAGFSKAPTTMGSAGQQVTFADVAGAQEEKEELQEVVAFLKDPEKFRRIGAQIPRGVLLEGPPGTGKTLLARAVAGEAEVPFLSISGSDFVELYVGVGAGRVRDLFEQAKKVAPSIIFIDEIDAVGRRRGAGMGGGHDEREQTLNQLLVAMDGFQKNENVIVLAATNRQDILDPALLRPGRFDRQIYVGRPDTQGREEILKVHARKKRLAEDVDLHKIALATGGFTGADLSNLLNEAAILAVREDRQSLNMEDLDAAMMKILGGPEKKSRKRLDRDRRVTAIHEAGHAVAMYNLPTHDPVHKITILPRGRALGLTVSLPEEDSDHLTRNEMFEQIVSLLGGRVAEALCVGDVSTGASNDLQRASQLARDMVMRYGMSDVLGPVSFGDDGEIFVGRDYEKTKSYSEKTAGEIDSEVHDLMEQAYSRCRKILEENREKLDQVTDYLLAHDTMSGQAFRACMEGKNPDDATDVTIFDTTQE